MSCFSESARRCPTTEGQERHASLFSSIGGFRYCHKEDDTALTAPANSASFCDLSLHTVVLESSYPVSTVESGARGFGAKAKPRTGGQTIPHNDLSTHSFFVASRTRTGGTLSTMATNSTWAAASATSNTLMSPNESVPSKGGGNAISRSARNEPRKVRQKQCCLALSVGV